MGESTRRQTAWSYKAGSKGENRIRVHERRGGGFGIDYRDENGRHQEYLDVATREEAKAKADAIAKQFRDEAKEAATIPTRTAEGTRLTLGELLDTYEVEVTSTKAESTQEHDRRAFELFRRFWGPERHAETLSRREWDAYIAARRSGRLKPPKAREGTVRNRIIQQDLKLLKAVFAWALLVELLERNRLKPLKTPREDAPRRPVITTAQYAKLCSAAASLGPRQECFLMLVWETGHRSASVRQLRWSDVNVETRRVHWPGDRDKVGNDHWNPLTDAAVSILKRERSRVATIGDAWIFPDPADAEEPLSRHSAADLWRRLARIAELPKGEGIGWHSCRRAFAQRLRKADVKTLQELGGWTNASTVLDIYLQTDEDAQREALREIGAIARTASNGN